MELGGGLCGQAAHRYVFFPCSPKGAGPGSWSAACLDSAAHQCYQMRLYLLNALVSNLKKVICICGVSEEDL